MADPWAAFDGPAAPATPQAAVASPEPATAAPAPAGDPWEAFHGPATSDASGGLSAEQLAYGKDAYGRPYQSMGNVPTNDPVGQSTGTTIRTDRVPGVVTQAIGSLPTDPEQKRRVIAGQLFPGMDPAEAQSRVFYGVNQRLAAVGKDGIPFYVEPEPYAPDVTHPSTLIPSNIPERVAGMAGPALPAVTGLAAGAATGPASLVVGPIAAGVGAAAGDVGRQSLAAHFDPQPGFTYNPVQTLGEAGGAATGQLIGAGILRGLSPNRLGASALDIGTVRSGATMADANRLNALAASQGVRLTPGQASGLPSLLGHEDAIASGSAGPGLTDIAANYYGGQRNELLKAGQAALDRVSPASDKTDAAMIFQQGAEDATRLARQNANAAARPSYEAAQTAGQVMSPDLAQLMDVPAVQSAMNKARGVYRNLYRTDPPDAPDFAMWDLTKRALDDAHTTAVRAGERTDASGIDSVRKDLLTHLDAAYPTYGEARATAAPGQRLATRLESSVGGAVGDGTERAKAIMAPVFNSNNPRAIAEARDAFNAAGRGDEWNAGTRAYLQDQFDTASKSIDGLNPAMLRRQIWSNPDAKSALQAAMDPQAFQGLDHFMQVVEATAQSRGMNSLTAPRMAGAKALETASGDAAGVKAANLAGDILTPSSTGLFGMAGRPFHALGDYLQRRNLQNISQRLFSPDGMEYLRQMGTLPVGSQKAISATAEFLGQTGGRGAASYSRELPQPAQNALMLH